MKKLFTIPLMTLVAVGSAALAVNTTAPVVDSGNQIPVTQITQVGDDTQVKHHNATMEDRNPWDFEDGEDGFTHFGNGIQEDWWHADTEHAWDGNSWWSSDAANGGYLNDSYMVLDTQPFDLTGTTSPVLTFKLFWYYETPGGEPAPYNGWDAGNVRVSTDGGDTWTPISGTPAYTFTSAYSFGYQIGEGAGVPGWGSDSHGWNDASFDLSAYNTFPNVMVRWASCADPGFDSTDDPNLIGMVIDDVSIDDGGTNILWFDADTTPPEFVPTHGYVTGNDFWERDDEFGGHESDWSFRCEDEPNINPYLMSPEITLTPDMTIFLSQWVWCDVPDSDGDDNGFLEDYYHVHLTTDGGITWTDLCYDYARDYNSAGFGLMDQAAIFNGSLELTDYAGQTIQIGYSLGTDGNDDGGNGLGLFIDDATILETDTPADDCGISKIWLDAPRTENLERNVGVQLNNFGLNSQFNIPAFYMVEKEGVPVQAMTALAPFQTEVGALDYVRYYGTLAPFTPVDGPGIYTFIAWTQLTGDEDQSNDTLFYDFNVYENGRVLFIYDDDISSAWTLDEADWALIRVDQDLGFGFNAKWFTALMYNMEIGDDVNVVIYDAGVDDENVGAQIADLTYQVGAVYPDYDHFYIGDIPELQGRTTDFWIGVHGPCGIVGLNEVWWISHSYYGYDDAGFVIEPWGGDLSMLVEGCYGDGCFYYANIHLDIIHVGEEPQLDWNDIDSADSYSIYRSDVPYFTPAPENLLVDGILVSEYEDTGATGKYFYVVTAVRND